MCRLYVETEMKVRNMNICVFILCFVPCVFMFPDQGQWTKSYENVYSVPFGKHKTLYADSSVSLAVNCEPVDGKNVHIKIGWVLRQTSCFEEYLSSDLLNDGYLQRLYKCPMDSYGISRVRYLKSEPLKPVECSSLIHLTFRNLSFETADNTKNSFNPECQDPSNALVDRFPSFIPESENQKQPEEIPENAKTSVTNIEKKNDKSDFPGKHPNQVKMKRAANDVDSAILIIQNSTLKTSQTENSHKTESELDSSTATQPSMPGPLNDVHSKVVKSGSKIAKVDMDGVYLFILNIETINHELINVVVDVSMKGDYGYLSAVDYPLLLFYGYMCGIYAVYAFSWLVVSALQWRDLLRIQFWIGGVILLGLTEKAVFYAEYQSINYTGQSVQGAVIFAEILSCLKRTLARMLVIIVSLGFGIVKPRLGPMLHRVVGVGALYFVLGAAEGCLRVLKPKNDPSNQALMAGIPLAVTDSAICWWIFSSLVQTNRTLRLRRNLVKLSLYRHFTNTLIFAVIASVAYMVWSIHSHKLVTCITDWKELWVDEAYWHLLFSLLLLVIMILWRPTNNNQRYAYTPLLDAMDDENEDDFDQNITNDAFVGMKMRASKNPVSPSEKDVDEKQEDDLKWVEENVPSTFTETAVPTFLDSDEEIMTAKFERSKME